MIPSWLSKERIPSYLHYASLAVAALILLRAMRGQWFHYDEWDFLVSGHLWELLAPHNGHLSFLPALITAILYSIVGLHAYWPFLAVTVLLHLAIAHLLWRVMRRAGVQPYIAVTLSLLFAVLASGADNILWAFQTGFILPVFFGLIAYLVITSEKEFTTRRVVVVGVLLLAGLASASTAIPITVALGLLLLVRKGWRPTLIAAAIAGIPYLAWFALFNLKPSGASGFGASSISDFVAGVPQFMAHGFLGSLAKTLPVAELAPALLVVWAVWMIIDLARVRGREISGTYYLVVAALVFSLLTAVTRLQLGDAEAASGRYVYFYVAMLIPAFGLFLTFLVKRSAVAITIVSVLVLAVSASSAVALLAQANAEATREQFTRQAMSAVVELSASSDLDPDGKPIPVYAPQLRVADILQFSDSGALDGVEVSPSALLSTELALGLTSDVVAETAPDDCGPLSDDGYARFQPGEERLLYSPIEQNVTVSAGRGDAYTEAVVVQVDAGLNDIEGFGDLAIAFTPTVPAGVCYLPAPQG